MRWAWEHSGNFSVSSAYNCRYIGRETDPLATVSWDNHAPLRCKIFAWRAFKNRCWTSDRLARRGLPHQAQCPLCDQLPETVDHLLVACVFTRTVWHKVWTAWGKPEWTPGADDRLVSWSSTLHHDEQSSKDLHSVLLLVMWETWKHRNSIVFDGATLSESRLLRRIVEEGKAWCMAGLLRRGFSALFDRLSTWVSGEE